MSKLSIFFVEYTYKRDRSRTSVHDRSHLPIFSGRQAVQVGDQPVPVTVAVGGRLNMAGLFSQDALGGGQGHRVFVDDGV
jgi:hypothetical protein